MTSNLTGYGDHVCLQRASPSIESSLLLLLDDNDFHFRIFDKSDILITTVHQKLEILENVTLDDDDVAEPDGRALRRATAPD